MCNAIQQRMVEESLVGKDVHEAMMTMRTRLNGIFGLSTSSTEIEELPDVLPEGTGQPLREGRTAAIKRPAATGYRSLGNQVDPEVLEVADIARQRQQKRQQGADDGAKRPVKPYIPPTVPRDSGNPFPGLSGPLG